MNLERIKIVPIPICGVILSLFGLGLFFKDVSIAATEIFSFMGIVLIACLLLKVFLFREESAEDLRSPVILGTSGTFPMALMILGALLKDISYSIGLAVWLIAFIGHVMLIVYFTKKHILNFSMELVYTNYFVVFIGIGMASITGAAFSLQAIVDLVFAFSFVSMIALLVLVSYRYLKVPIVKNPFKPLVCIYAAPFSLVLCAFIQTSFPHNIDFIIALYVLSIIFYIFGLIKAVEYICLPFFPTFTAFTFPFVISATATKQVINALNVNLDVVLAVQAIIAIALVLYVLASYIRFVVTAPIE